MTTVKQIDQTATVGWNDGYDESDGDEEVAAQWAYDAIEDWLVERDLDPGEANSLYVAWQSESTQQA